MRSVAAQPRIQASIRYLQKEVLERNDLEDLCWGCLSLRPYQVDLPVERIIAAYEQRPHQPWLRASPVRTALTALALGIAQAEPFRLTVDAALGARRSVLPAPHSSPLPWSEWRRSPIPDPGSAPAPMQLSSASLYCAKDDRRSGCWRATFAPASTGSATTGYSLMPLWYRDSAEMAESRLHGGPCLS